MITFIAAFSALWPVFSTIFIIIISGIVVYYKDKALLLRELNSAKEVAREEQVRSEKEIAILKEKIIALELVTDHLTRAGEGIKDKLDTIEPRLAAIDVKLNFIIDYIKKEDK